VRDRSVKSNTAELLRAACLLLFLAPLLLRAQRPAARTITRHELQRLPRSRLAPHPLLSVSDDTVDFGRLAGACFDSRGRAAVVSTAPQRLLALEPGGAPSLRIVGRAGRGPGELDQPWGVSCWSEDSVAVLEMARITTLRLDAPRLVTAAVQLTTEGQWGYAVARFADGRHLLRRQGIVRRMDTGTERDSVELLVAQGPLREGGTATPVLRLPAQEVVRAHTGSTITNAIHPFGRALLVAAGGEAFFAMDTGEPLLRAFAPDGTPLRHLRLDLSPRSLRGSDIAAARDKRLAAARTPEARQLAQRLNDETRWPQHLPWFDRLVAAQDGGVLLREFLVEGDRVARWLRLDRELRAVAYVELDPSVRLLAAAGDRVIVIRDDAEGERLEYFRLVSHP